MRDQEAGGVHLLRQTQLDAAVDVAGHERIFVTDHDDPAADVLRVPLEIVSPAQTEIEDFRHNARCRRRAKKRRARQRRARRRIGQLRGSTPPTGIVHGLGPKPCAGHRREALFRKIKRRGFARRACEPAAAIAQRQEVGPHLRGAGIDRRNVGHWGLIPTDLTMSAQRLVSLSISV